MTIDPHEDDFEYTVNDSLVFRSKLKRLHIPPFLHAELDSTWLRKWEQYCLWLGWEPKGFTEPRNWNPVREEFFEYCAHQNDPTHDFYDPQ